MTKIITGGISMNDGDDSNAGSSFLGRLSDFLGEAIEVGGNIIDAIRDIDIDSDDYDFLFEKAGEVSNLVSSINAIAAKEAMKSKENLDFYSKNPIFYSKNPGKFKRRDQSYLTPETSALAHTIDDIKNKTVKSGFARDHYNGLMKNINRSAVDNNIDIVNELRRYGSLLRPIQPHPDINIMSGNDIIGSESPPAKFDTMNSSNLSSGYYSNLYERDKRRLESVRFNDNNPAMLNNQNQIAYNRMNRNLNRPESGLKLSGRNYSDMRYRNINPADLNFKINPDDLIKKLIEARREHTDKVLKEAFSSDKNTVLFPESAKEYKQQKELVNRYISISKFTDVNKINHLELDQLSKVILSDISAKLAKKDRNLHQTDNLMQKSIYNLEDQAQGKVNYRFDIDNQSIIQSLKVPDFLAKKITNSTRGIVFSPKSELAQAIKKSRVFRDEIQNIKEGRVNSLSFEQEDSRDLFGSLHNVTVLGSYKLQNGDYKVILFDYYDFDLDKKYDNPFWVSINNAAWLLQSIREISNYYLIIPINIPKEELDKTIKIQ